MRCTECGYNAEDGVEFCPNCGEYLGKKQSGTNQTYNEPKVEDQEKKESEPNGESGGFNNNSEPEPINFDIPMNQSCNTAPTKSMGWYKFLVNFALIAGAILNIIGGIMFMTGGSYGDSADMVYAVIPNLKPLDIFMGFCYIAVAVLGFVTRNALAKFKSNGPTLLIAIYIVDIVLGIVYYVALKSIIPPEIMTVSFDDTTSIGASVVMIIINSVYFKNRREMFVN